MNTKKIYPSAKISTASDSLIGRLNLEWEQLRIDPGVQATLERWAVQHPVLREHSPLVEASAAGPTVPEEQRDEYFLALLTYAAEGCSHDRRLAARIVLQLMLPRVTRLSRGLRPLARDERESAAVAAAYEAIASYPLHRRTRVVPNLSLDMLRLLQLRLGITPDRREVAEIPVDVLPERLEQPLQGSPSDELARLLVWAVRTETLSAFDARILSNGLAQGQDAALADEFGLSIDALRQRRLRAIRKLRAAVSAYDADLALTERPAVELPDGCHE